MAYAIGEGIYSEVMSGGKGGIRERVQSFLRLLQRPREMPFHERLMQVGGNGPLDRDLSFGTGLRRYKK